jgi:uncharacterized protein (DUF305 family)
VTATVTSSSTEAPTAPNSRVTTIVLVVVLSVAALIIAGTGGWLLRGDGGSTVKMSSSSVDAGFARDMSTHHTQAVTMAGYERDNTTNAGLKVLAYDIETSQEFQLGEMQGWLDGWGLSRESSEQPMAWMSASMHMHIGAGGLMPGMATPAQMNRLQTLHGKALDVLFLQLMIHHHQGGVPMAKYAIEHASTGYVRDLAQSIYNAQTAEIVEMEQLLRGLGGTPLPAPAS